MLNFGSDATSARNVLELELPPTWIGAEGKSMEAELLWKRVLQSDASSA
jgi:hypothetical protein